MEIWKFLGGLGFFLYGMSMLESVLKSISGRSAKLFLKKHTQSLFKSITGGAIITSIVQSSTVVSLIVLAFVESGIITFRNAMGVLLGANVGTTVTAWLVVLIGFELDVITYALPFIAISAIFKFLFKNRRNLNYFFSFFLSLGILFLGLGYMKEGGQILGGSFDITPYTQQGTLVFVFIGFVLTTIIQASSATVAIALTALHSGAIDFPAAAAIVIGSEVGTTLKTLLWGAKGSVEKKRTAWGNFGFNVFTTILAYAFLHWIIYFIQNIIGITDTLIALAFFQSTINISSIILFIPLLGVFSKWIEKRIGAKGTDGGSYISRELPVLPVLAGDALKDEVLHLLEKIQHFNRRIVAPEHTQESGVLETLKSFAAIGTNIEDEYVRLKKTEGDILEYYVQVQGESLGEYDAQIMMPYITALRYAINAAKAMKNIAHNFKEFDASVNDVIQEQKAVIEKQWLAFEEYVQTMTPSANWDITPYLTTIAEQEKEAQALTIAHIKSNRISDLEASTLLNVYHEIRTSKEAILSAFAILKPTNNHIR